MQTTVFLRDLSLWPVPPDLIPHLTHVLRLAGHRVRWNPESGHLFVDSPLEGRIIRGKVLGEGKGLAGRTLGELLRWVKMAGGVVLDSPSRRPDAAIYIQEESCGSGEHPAILVVSRPHGWFGQRSTLAAVVAEKLRDAIELPVGIAHARSVGQGEVRIQIKAPGNEQVTRVIARAIWQGLMTGLGTGKSRSKGSAVSVAQVAAQLGVLPQERAGASQTVARAHGKGEPPFGQAHAGADQAPGQSRPGGETSNDQRGSVMAQAPVQRSTGADRETVPRAETTPAHRHAGVKQAPGRTQLPPPPEDAGAGPAPPEPSSPAAQNLAPKGARREAGGRSARRRAADRAPTRQPRVVWESEGPDPFPAQPGGQRGYGRSAPSLFPVASMTGSARHAGFLVPHARSVPVQGMDGFFPVQDASGASPGQGSVGFSGLQALPANLAGTDPTPPDQPVPPPGEPPQPAPTDGAPSTAPGRDSQQEPPPASAPSDPIGRTTELAERGRTLSTRVTYGTSTRTDLHTYGIIAPRQGQEDAARPPFGPIRSR